MLGKTIKFEGDRFLRQEESLSLLKVVCAKHDDLCHFEKIGESEEGRPIAGIRVGTGAKSVSLISGAHSDEPVGSETLRTLILGLTADRDENSALLKEHSFFIVPHVNPDGEIRNSTWMEEWPDVSAYIRGAFREPPGRDVEFSYPSRRPENRVVSDWLSQHGPFALHVSLHGMGFSDGAMLLIERNWTYRTEHLQSGFIAAAANAGLRMHDHNRKGEKGFFNVGAGFTTTPEGAAMRNYFRSHGKNDVAELFGDSSMEFVKKLGGDPLCLVTELPLFVVNGEAEPGFPKAYLNFKADLPKIRIAVEKGRGIETWSDRYGLSPLPIETAVSLQLRAIELGLETISSLQ